MRLNTSSKDNSASNSGNKKNNGINIIQYLNMLKTSSTPKEQIIHSKGVNNNLLIHHNTFDYFPTEKSINNSDGEGIILTRSPFENVGKKLNNEKINCTSEKCNSLNSISSQFENQKFLYIKGHDGREYEINQERFLSHCSHLKEKFVNLSGTK